MPFYQARGGTGGREEGREGAICRREGGRSWKEKDKGKGAMRVKEEKGMVGKWKGGEHAVGKRKSCYSEFRKKRKNREGKEKNKEAGKRGKKA